MPRYYDLSAPLVPTPEGLPELLAVRVDPSSHADGAEAIESMLGVGPELLRDGEGWAVETISLGTHNTTHVDAPWHYNSTIQGSPAATIDELPLDWFHGPGVVIEARGRDEGDALTVEDFERGLEQAGHELQAGDVVLVRTGGDRFLDDPGYMALGCGVTAQATVWLCDQGIRLMGIDAWGWDRPLHLEAEDARAADEKGIFWAAHQCDRAYSQIERLAGLDALPLTGFEVFAFPLKVVGGSAGPARVVAIEPG
ncbi:MAG: cyclase family protein [Acidobacteria bacterium]|nr:cyclase family protein [Acidobacteriota bacterium]